MKGINQEFIDEVLSKNDIVDVISKYVTLSRRGLNYWACCPFHMEKTPSMSVKQDGQFFKCFGCGEGGNAITFIMKMENVDFIQALEILCKNVGMSLPTMEETNEMVAKKKLRDKLLNILNETCLFYQNNLTTIKAQPYLNYINNRGLNQEMIEKFKIGASLDYDGLVNHLKSKGFSFEDMMQAGVVGLGEKGGYYDFYGGRLIFPIFNGMGEVVGFSGRDISNNPEKAKYKNTPQTLLFNKSGLIYGFNFLRELKRKKELDSIILVEGQMDVIACHQAGITNAIGCLGTALTSNHAKDLAHLSNNIILCLDGDSAGATATYKALTILREANMNVSVVRLTGAKDPDEYIKKFGRDQFIDNLANAINYMEFILLDLAKKYDLNKTNEKNDYINESLKYLSKLSTATEQEIYLTVLREIVNVPIDALRRTLSGSKEEIKPKEQQLDEIELKNNNYIVEAKTLILASLLHKKITDAKPYIDLFETQDDFKEIFNFVLEKQSLNQIINISSLYLSFNITSDSVWDKIINYNFPTEDVFNSYFYDSVKRLRISIFKIKKEEYKAQLNHISSLDQMYYIVGKIKEIDELIKKVEEEK